MGLRLSVDIIIIVLGGSQILVLEGTHLKNICFLILRK